MGSVSGGKNNSNGRIKNRQVSDSVSGTRESALSQEQLAILQERRRQYNEIFFPELKRGIQEGDPGSAVFNARLGNNVRQVNAAFDSAQQATEQRLAQQNLAGNSGGVSGALYAQNERARASALANAYAGTLEKGQAQKARYMQFAMGMSPQATTAANYHQSSVSHSEGTGDNWSRGSNFNFGVQKS